MGRARKKRNSAVPDDIDPPHETRHACRVEIENEEVRKVRKGFIHLFVYVYTCTRDAHQDMVKIGDLGGSSNRIN